MKSSSLHRLTTRVDWLYSTNIDLIYGRNDAGEFRLLPKRVAELNPDVLELL